MKADTEEGQPLKGNEPSSPVPAATSASSTLKYMALLVLVLQNALLALVMRYSQVVPTPTRYLATTAVFTGELLKLAASFFLVVVESGSVAGALSTLKTYTVDQPVEFLSVGVPSLLYVLQNNLAFLATANLEPAPYQLLYQLKIFTTAVLSVFLLGKVMTAKHWQALLVLFVGVGCVQLSTLEDKGDGAAAAAKGDPLLGLFAVLVAVTSSGLAGVWFEKILKQKPGSVWVRNVQMSLISLVIAGLSVYAKDWPQVTRHGFFSGYSAVVWAVIVLQAGGGMLVAVVVKYADNILKGFATSLSTVLSTVVSVSLFGFVVSPLFLAGAVLVLGSAFLYNSADGAQKAAAGGKAGQV